MPIEARMNTSYTSYTATCNRCGRTYRKRSGYRDFLVSLSTKGWLKGNTISTCYCPKCWEMTDGAPTAKPTPELKDLGYANSWAKTPRCVLDSRAAGHEIIHTEIGRSLTRYSCLEGGWTYRVDSSD